MSMLQHRTIRIFVSSTFKDMHSERDYLVKFIFPELRELCRQKGLHLVDIDLRWGVTEDEAEEGKALEICLEEIENCRPFFIGLLGERYGWVPEKYELPNLEKYDWVRTFERGYSITALEIYQGVLRHPHLKSRAFFYLRDSGFMQDVPLSKLPEMEAEDGEAAVKLSRLKEDIREAFRHRLLQSHITENYPCRYQGIKINWAQVMGNQDLALTPEERQGLDLLAEEHNVIGADLYHQLTEAQRALVDAHGVVYLEGLYEFGQKVLNHLRQAIEEEYPEQELESDPLTMERNFHENFLLQRTRLFVGREEILHRIGLYTASDTMDKPVFISGEPGSGKSAIMARAVLDFRRKYPQGVSISRFVGASPRSKEIYELISSIVEEIAAVSSFKPERQRMADMESLSEYFCELLYRIPPAEKVVIAIDALNQLGPFHDPMHLAWLPKVIPSNIKILLSSLEDEYLESARKYNLPAITAPGLETGTGREIVVQKLGEFRKALSEEQMNSLLEKEEAGKPLYLAVACEELRTYPKFEEISSRISRLAPSVPGLFDQVIDGLEKDHGRPLVKDALSLLECSAHGLLEEELLFLLKDQNEAKLPANTWARLYRSIMPYMSSMGGKKEGLLFFFHQQLSFAVRGRFLQAEEEERNCFRRLASYGLMKYRQNTGTPYSCELYAGVYLYRAGMGEELFALLGDIFSSPKDRYSANQAIAHELFDRVTSEKNPQKEHLLRSVLEQMTDQRFREHLPAFLSGKSHEYSDSGKTPWALTLSLYGVRLLEKWKEDSPWDKGLLREIITRYNQAAYIYQALGESGKAARYFNRALKMTEALLEHESDLELWKNYAINLRNLARVYQSRGHRKKALQAVSGALEVAEKLAAEEPRYTVLVGDIHNEAGAVMLQWDVAKAGAYFLKAAEVYEALLNTTAETRELLYPLAASYNNLAEFYKKSGQLTYALKQHAKALRIMERLAEQYPGDTRYRNHAALALNNLGKLSLAEGNLDSGASYLAQALKIWDELLAEEPYRMDYRERAASLYGSVAQYFRGSVEPEKVLAFCHKSIELTRELVSMDPLTPGYKDELGKRYGTAGDIYQDSGKRHESQRCYLEAIKIMDELCRDNPGHPGYKERRTLYREKVASLCPAQNEETEVTGGPADSPAAEESPSTLSDQVLSKIALFKKWREEAGAWQDLGEMEKAVELYNRCMGLLHEMMPLMEDPVALQRNQALIYNHLCLLYLQNEEVEKALSYFEKSMDLLNELHQENPENLDVLGDLKDGWFFISNYLMENSKPADALDYYLKGLDYLETLVSLDPEQGTCRELVNAYNFVGNLYGQLKDFQHAAASYCRGAAFLEELADHFPQSRELKAEAAESYGNIAGYCSKVGLREPFLTCLEEAGRLYEGLLIPGEISEAQGDLAVRCAEIHYSLALAGPEEEKPFLLQKARNVLLPFAARETGEPRVLILWQDIMQILESIES